jgi:ankyrin repeat protein
LILAVKRNFVEIVGFLLEQNGIDVNAANCEGKSALMIAARDGQMKIVQMLCEEPAIDYEIVDSDVVFGFYRHTCLLLAALYMHPEVSAFLEVKKNLVTPALDLEPD